MRSSDEYVLIVDCGAQFGKLIDRRCRELNVRSEMKAIENIQAEDLCRSSAIIISGGPGSVTDSSESTHNLMELLNSKYESKPVLGICYGMQLLCGNGKVEKADKRREDGQVKINVNANSKLFKDLKSSSQLVLLTHGDVVTSVPSNFEVVARSTEGNEGIVAVEAKDRKWYGVQFHPEVDLTLEGETIIKSFLFTIAGLTGDYKLEDRMNTCINYIKERVQGRKVLLLLSGGVDSTVCAALMNKALNKDQIYALHVDNGFMRQGESEQVVQALNQLDLSVRVVNASHHFYHGDTTLLRMDEKGNMIHKKTDLLCRVTDPEEKRAVIGDTFMDVAKKAISEWNLNPDEVMLGQGTLRPDLIESASNLASHTADLIKTHHNDTDLVRKLRSEGKVVEPLMDFHKDEVRKLGTQLGLPDELVHRHPFPGPGLAIRILCQIEPFLEKSFSETQVLCKLVVDYNHMLQREHALLNRVQNATSSEEQQQLLEISKSRNINATVLPIRTVGVQGDKRSYSYAVALSCEDQEVDWSKLFFLAKLIPRVCHTVNRVTFVFGPKLNNLPIHEITPTLLTPRVIETLRLADQAANSVLRKGAEYNRISQMPLVLIPIHFDRQVSSELQQQQQQQSVMRTNSFQRSVVIRPFVTHDFMTGTPAIPGRDMKTEVLYEMVDEIMKVAGISRVLYDLTAKPPATTEWE